MQLFTIIDLAYLHMQFTFFHNGHTALTVMYQFVDVGDVIKACVIVSNMT